MSATSTIARLHTAAVYLQLAAERFHIMGEPINAEEATQASIMARVLADRLAMHPDEGTETFALSDGSGSLVLGPVEEVK